MKLKFLVVVVTLGKVNRMYLSVETSLCQHRSAVAFRKSWTMARQEMIKLSERAYRLMSWKKAANVFRFLAELILLLDRLRNYFDFYQQPYSACRICIDKGRQVKRSRVGLNADYRFTTISSQSCHKFSQRLILNNSISSQSNTILCWCKE